MGGYSPLFYLVVGNLYKFTKVYSPLSLVEKVAIYYLCSLLWEIEYPTLITRRILTANR